MSLVIIECESEIYLKYLFVFFFDIEGEMSDWPKNVTAFSFVFCGGEKHKFFIRQNISSISFDHFCRLYDSVFKKVLIFFNKEQFQDLIFLLTVK